MLNYSDFQPFEAGTRHNFKFKKLRPLNEEREIYAQTTTNRNYRVSLFTNRSQVEILSQLWKRGIWGNLKGLFKKKHMFYAIAEAECAETLAQYLERYQGRRDQITQLFCLQLIESITSLANTCQELGCSIKILNPFYVIIQEKQGRLTAKLKYPYCHSLFQGLSCEIAARQAEFCAPQILLVMHKEYDLINQMFSKAILYSLGLVMLYCFGYRIKSEERVLALKNGKEFAMFLKAIRKEIKVFHEGKFISKLIKILLEQSQEVRDNLETFALKLHSPHLQSLRKFVFRPQAVKDSYIPTIYSDHSEIARKSRLDRTIEIQGSASNKAEHANSNKSEHSSRENGRENGEPVRSVLHFPTFRKSAENVFHQDLVEEQPPKQGRQGRGQLGLSLGGSNGQLPSPIDIKIDWEDQESDEIPHSTRRSMTPVKKHLTDNENVSEELEIVVTGVSKEAEKDKFSYSQGKRSGAGGSKSRVQARWRIQEQVQGQNENQQEEQNQRKMKSELNEHSSINLSRRGKDANQEEPEIIKYEYENDLVHKQIKKKLSNKQSVELQDMTLNEDQCEEEEEPEDVDPPNTRLDELHAELGKKAEAVFIILLVSFLIYKIIDYVVT